MLAARRSRRPRALASRAPRARASRSRAARVCRTLARRGGRRSRRARASCARSTRSTGGRSTSRGAARRAGRGARRAAARARRAATRSSRGGRDARADAREVLAEGRFQRGRVPGPFRGIIDWLGDRCVARRRLARRPAAGRALGRLDRARRGPGRRGSRGSSRGASSRAASARPRRRSRRSRRPRDEDPRALDRRADAAEAAGDLEAALRLRFRAGLLRLDARGAIEFRPSISTYEVRRTLHAEDFDALAATFDDVVYGGRPPAPDDVAAARERWPAASSSGGSGVMPRDRARVRFGAGARSACLVAFGGRARGRRPADAEPKGPPSSSYATSPARAGGVRVGAASAPGIPCGGVRTRIADAGAAHGRDAGGARSRRDGARGGAGDRRLGARRRATSWPAARRQAPWLDEVLDDPPEWERSDARQRRTLVPVGGHDRRERGRARRRRLARARRRAARDRAAPTGRCW